MSTLRLALAVLGLAVLPPAAAANQAPPDGGGGSDSNKNHVREVKPWKPRFEYRMVRNAPVHDELNGRADVIAQVVKGQWWRIDCQLVNRTQHGDVLWNHIPNVGWVADAAMKTYTDGRIPGSPTCAKPGPDHVWFQQAWASSKQYRLVRGVPGRTRPAGARRAGERYGKGSWTTIDCSGSAAGRAWVRVYQRPKVGESWIRADALRFWQKGLPAGLPSCGGSAVSTRYVALGDSYAAGIGAGSYYAESGSCRRSWKAYWALLEPRLRSGVISQLSDFEACSGDTTSDLLRKLGPLNRDTSLVTVSIGGNDMHFADVVRGCVYPGGRSCREEIASRITTRALNTLRSRLDRVYRAIRARAPRALVLVLGYPELVPRDHVDGCGAMDDGDAPALHRAATLVNGAIADTVGRRPRFRFVGLVRTFLGHPACNKDATDWINGVTRLAGGDASFHPNVAGNAAIAARIRQAAPRFFGS